MTPFLHFRVWWHGAPSASRAAAAVSGLVVIALLVWIAVPPGRGSSTVGVSAGAGVPPGAVSSGGSRPATAGGANASASQTAPGAGNPLAGGVAAAGPGGQASPAAAASSPGGGPAAGSPATPTTAAISGCTGPPARLTVGVVLDDVSGLNATFGIPSPSGQQAEFNAVLDSVNKSGGAGCYTLVPDFQTYNEFDTSTAQAACLQFAQQKAFAVLNGFLPTSTDDCVLQHHIPLFEVQPVGGADVQGYFPYYFSAHSEYQRVYRNFAYATQQLGVWQAQNGFRKLGIWYRDCQPDVNAALLADLAQVGVPATKVSKFDAGCPADFASPTAIEQAILQFKAAGVTTVTIDNDIGDAQNLTKTAQAQGFHPRWVIPDYGIVGATGSVQFQPDATNFDGALAITPDQYGAAASGLPESAGTKACDQVMTSHGQAPVAGTSSGFAGVVCDVAWMFTAALKNASGPVAAQLVAGLQKAGTLDYAFPFGPPDFTGAGTTFGGEHWRPVTFHGSCGCWKVDTATFQPSF